MNQNINRVDHVIWASNLETIEKNVATLNALCRVQLQGPFDRPDVGVRAYLSWESGLEIIAPLDDALPVGMMLRKFIDRRGEGLFSVCIGVPDIEEAGAHAASLGREVSDVVENIGGEPWGEKTTSMKEIVVGEFLNAMMIFGEIEYVDGIIQTKSGKAPAR